MTLGPSSTHQRLLACPAVTGQTTWAAKGHSFSIFCLSVFTLSHFIILIHLNSSWFMLMRAPLDDFTSFCLSVSLSLCLSLLMRKVYLLSRGQRWLNVLRLQLFLPPLWRRWHYAKLVQTFCASFVCLFAWFIVCLFNCNFFCLLSLYRRWHCAWPGQTFWPKSSDQCSLDLSG